MNEVPFFDPDWRFRWYGRHLAYFGPLSIQGEPLLEGEMSGTRLSLWSVYTDDTLSEEIVDERLLAALGRKFVDYYISKHTKWYDLVAVDIEVLRELSSASKNGLASGCIGLKGVDVPFRVDLTRSNVRLRFSLAQTDTDSSGLGNAALIELIFEEYVDCLPFAITIWSIFRGVED